MPDFFLFIISSLYVVFCVLFALFLHKKTKLSSEVLRKIIHIGVSNWYFLYLLFNSWVLPVITLITAAIIIFYGVINDVPQRCFGEKDGSRSWGLIYYPLSIVFLIFFEQLGILSNSSLGCGFLAMGYGDGFAALIGKKWGLKKISVFSGNKTWIGTFVMFIVTLTVCVLLKGWNPLFIIVAAIGAMIEAFSPLALDNITVPIGISFIVEILC